MAFTFHSPSLQVSERKPRINSILHSIYFLELKSSYELLCLLQIGSFDISQRLHIKDEFEWTNHWAISLLDHRAKFDDSRNQFALLALSPFHFHSYSLFCICSFVFRFLGNFDSSSVQPIRWKIFVQINSGNSTKQTYPGDLLWTFFRYDGWNKGVYVRTISVRNEHSDLNNECQEYISQVVVLFKKCAFKATLWDELNIHFFIKHSYIYCKMRNNENGL